MSKDLYNEISAHFAIESVENYVANRRNCFINTYGEADNYLCQLLRFFSKSFHALQPFFFFFQTDYMIPQTFSVLQFLVVVYVR